MKDEQVVISSLNEPRAGWEKGFRQWRSAAMTGCLTRLYQRLLGSTKTSGSGNQTFRGLLV